MVQFAAGSVAMAAAVALGLWVLLAPTRSDRLAGAAPEQKLGDFGRTGLPLVPGDCGPLVTQMQGKLVKKGYSVSPAGADGNFNDDTLTALEAFQDDNALTVQPKCDQQCWTALGLSEPGSVRGVIEGALVGGIFQSPACGRALANNRRAVALP
jgi:peptidoglycan hydrolase-like protein with peptidoglycan-binding domain